MFNFMRNASYLHMETTTKIQLSQEELGLVTNKEWILTRHNITKKVFEMFGELNEIMKKEASSYAHLFPGNIQYHNGKISKGENYRLLPYVILDYPALFGKDNIFSIRTMFWWGNFFSITLHLSGSYKENFITGNDRLLAVLQRNDFFICVNDDEWQHHFEIDNYIPASSIAAEDYRKIIEKDFFKISKKIPLAEWERATGFIIKTFRELMELLQISYPAGKKDP